MSNYRKQTPKGESVLFTLLFFSPILVVLVALLTLLILGLTIWTPGINWFLGIGFASFLIVMCSGSSCNDSESHRESESDRVIRKAVARGVLEGNAKLDVLRGERKGRLGYWYE